MALELAEGVIVSAPDDNDRVKVAVTGFDSQQSFDDVRYTPHGEDEPAPDDPCLVALDDDGSIAVVVWWEHA